jgi:DNA ligase-1
MKFIEFAEFLQDIETTGSRNEMTVKVSNFLDRLSLEEIKPAMYLIQGRLVPKFIAVEFNFSEKLVLRAIETSFEVNTKELYAKFGDAGTVIFETLNNKQISSPKNLEIEAAYKDLTVLASLSGKGSQEAKLKKYLEIISSLDPLSAKYATRIIVGNLRLGTSEKTILDAFSWLIKGDKSLRSDIDIAYGARSDLGELGAVILENKDNPEIESILETIKIKPGVPVASKLVERVKDSQSVWERMPNCFMQPKLDGLRGQLHYHKDATLDSIIVPSEVSPALLSGEASTSLRQIYSRNMESLTDQFPEILQALENLGVESIILDSEIIGFDEKNNKYFTYQETMTRRRKYDIDKFSSTFPVKAMCFDILYLNGEDLTQKPIEKRIELLSQIIGQQVSPLEMLDTKQSTSEEEVSEYFKDKVENGLEGIITKEVGSTYEPGTRNFKWIKLKANTRSDLVDTIDVVVLGYYSGGGDRARFGFGAILAGVYDPKEDKYYSIGKVGSGMKEDDLEKMFKDMQEYKTDNQPANVIVDKTLIPDQWILPKIVMEIVADEITRSPNHTAARGVETKVPRDDFAKGLSIRFPRMKIWKRDKDYPNTVDEIVRMYELRKGK